MKTGILLIPKAGASKVKEILHNQDFLIKFIDIIN